MSEKSDNKKPEVLNLTITGTCDKCGFGETVEGNFIDDHSPGVGKRKISAYGRLTKELQVDHSKRCSERLNITQG